MLVRICLRILGLATTLNLNLLLQNLPFVVHHETYIGHVTQNVDCEGKEFSAEPWSNPVPEGLIEFGVDCMRICLHVNTCFGITVLDSQCYLKNEKCFENLKLRDGAIIGGETPHAGVDKL